MDDLHPFTKSSEIGLGLTTVSTALLSGMGQISVKIGIELFLASTIYSMLPRLGSEVAFNECIVGRWNKWKPPEADCHIETCSSIHKMKLDIYH